MKRLRYLGLLVIAHLIAWSVVFVCVMGLDIKFVPTYFFLGWTFSGGELPSYIWLLSWPVFLSIVLSWTAVHWVSRYSSQ